MKKRYVIIALSGIETDMIRIILIAIHFLYENYTHIRLFMQDFSLIILKTKILCPESQNPILKRLLLKFPTEVFNQFNMPNNIE